MMFSDAALARRLELNKATAALEYARAQEKQRPGTTAVLPIAGGTAVFVGPTSPITRAMALGMQEPLTPADLDTVEAFFQSRGANPRLELCPLADRSLLELVGERGYRIDHVRNLLIRPVRAGEFLPEPTSSVVVTRAESPEEKQIWLRTVTQGFTGKDQLGPEDTLIPLPLTAVPAVNCYLAWQGDEPVGAGAMTVRGGLAYLSSTSVRPPFRGRGAQTALLWARLTDAFDAGCDLVMAETTPGSGSQRNLERMGFRVVYTTMAMAKS